MVNSPLDKKIWLIYIAWPRFLSPRNSCIPCSRCGVVKQAWQALLFRHVIDLIWHWMVTKVAWSMQGKIMLCMAPAVSIIGACHEPFQANLPAMVIKLPFLHFTALQVRVGLRRDVTGRCCGPWGLPDLQGPLGGCALCRACCVLFLAGLRASHAACSGITPFAACSGLLSSLTIFPINNQIPPDRSTGWGRFNWAEFLGMQLVPRWVCKGTPASKSCNWLG